VIAGDRRGHVRDERLGALVDDRQQLLANLPGVGHVDVFRQHHLSLPPGPLHREGGLRHRDRLSISGGSRRATLG
jgi:hypothetical protein